MTRIARKSEAQANAEALARRSSTYADEHASSWQVRFDRQRHEPQSLRGYVNELREAYQAECPTNLHVHDLDAGGGPAFSAAFERWLEGADNGPLRECLRGMKRSDNEGTNKRAGIVYRCVVGGVSAVEAAMAEGVPSWCAKIVAADALQSTWRQYASTPFRPLPRSVTAA